MKYRILITVTLMVLMLNNVSAYVINEGELTGSSYVETDVSFPDGATGIRSVDGIYVDNGGETEGLISTHLYIPHSEWGGGSNAYAKGDVIYEYPKGTEIATGYMYYWKMDTDKDGNYDEVYIKAYFDNGLPGLPSGKSKVFVNGSITTLIQFTKFYNYNDMAIINVDDKCVGIGVYYEAQPTRFEFIHAIHTSKILKTFYNKYYYWYTDDLFQFNIMRDAGNSSQIVIENNGGYELKNETSLQYDSIIVVSDDITNSTWYMTVLDNLGDTHEKTLEFIPIIEDTTPTLTTDKTYYNTSETITINTTNLQTIIDNNIGANWDRKKDAPYSVYFLYEVDEVYNDFETKGFFNIPYYHANYKINVNDDTYTIDTSFLVPEQKYRMGLVGDKGYYGLESDIILFSDFFYVTPDNEFITTSCTKTGNCYTSVGLPLSIYYNINNNSNIIIKDNDGTVINTIYNVIGNSSIVYNIPLDENKINTYPDWTIYINNTGYSTSYNTEVEIFWSNVIQPTPTPYYPPDEPDENVTNMTNELKDEVKPILDLIYGLSEIVVDNPDYDNDNIITEFEMNHWFNSLIPGCIVLFLVILYLGFKKR